MVLHGIDELVDCARSTLVELRRLYVSVSPDDPGYERACLLATVPDQYRDAVGCADLTLQNALALKLDYDTKREIEKSGD